MKSALESLAKFYLAMKGFEMLVAGIVALFWIILFVVVTLNEKTKKVVDNKNKIW